jgi:hypothetical protein
MHTDLIAINSFIKSEKVSAHLKCKRLQRASSNSMSTESNWGKLEMQKGHTIDKHAQSWGQVCWLLGWRRTTALLLFYGFPHLLCFPFLLCSLRPYF